MVSTISLAVQEKEQRQQQSMSVLNIDVYNYHSYMRLKAKINYMFTRANKFRTTYAVIILACIMLYFWPPLLERLSVDYLASSFPVTNGSSAMYTPFERALSQRCSLPPTGPVDGINSYTYMNILNMLLCMFITMLVMNANMDYHDLTRDYLDNSYRWFYLFRKIFIYYTVSCICNQLVSAFSCRSIHILYNLRFMSAVIVQIGGFFVCLLLAFLLGIKYALLDHA